MAEFNFANLLNFATSLAVVVKLLSFWEFKLD
jgi:hypothetical protein